jgi:diphthine synthase
MTLNIIGIGLCNEKDITFKGLEVIRNSEIVYLENYTSLLQCSPHDLAKFYNKEIILADRNTSEQESEKIIEEAKEKEVSFLIIGDPFSATTHIELVRLAREKKVQVNIVNNASILTAVGIVGLELYKYGKTTSIPFLDKFPQLETPYNVIKENQKIGLHTLCLLDIESEDEKFMTVNEAIKIIENIESRKKEKLIDDKTLIIGCARIGSDNFIVKRGTIKEIKKIDFGKPPHCLILPGKLHFMEEEIINSWV